VSNQALRWALELPIVGAKKGVLVALADHADDAGTCFPSLTRIALFAGTTDRGAARHSANWKRRAWFAGYEHAEVDPHTN
jgi:hypothetical protein